MFVLERKGAAFGDAEQETPVRQDVDCRHIFGDLDRIAKRQEDRGGAQLDRCTARQIREQREDRGSCRELVKMMLGEPTFVEIEIFGQSASWTCSL